MAPLHALIGEWTVEIPQFPGSHGLVTFEWLEGGAVLRYHTETPDPAPKDGSSWEHDFDMVYTRAAQV